MVPRKTPPQEFKSQSRLINYSPPPTATRSFGIALNYSLDRARFQLTNSVPQVREKCTTRYTSRFPGFPFILHPREFLIFTLGPAENTIFPFVFRTIYSDHLQPSRSQLKGCRGSVFRTGKLCSFVLSYVLFD